MQAIIFDYGGVLCFHPTDAQINALAERCGVSRGEFLRAYWGLRLPYDRGDFDGRGYWERVGAELGRVYSAQQIQEFIQADIHFWLELDDRMIAWIRQMRPAGIKVGLISNLPRDLGEYLRSNSALFSLFDHVTLSYEQRVVKPDAAIYLDCVAGLGVQPSEALFLDDKEPNVDGARAAGLKSLIFDSTEKMAESLAGVHHSMLPFGAPPIDLG